MLDLRTPSQRLGYDHTPAQAANPARNLLANQTRSSRWRPARDEVWNMIAPLLDDRCRVAIIGAGNGDDLPLRRIASNAGQVVLFDVDRQALRRARRRLPHPLRPRLATVEHDVTSGAADSIVSSIRRGLIPASVLDPALLSGSPYDLVIGELFYAQLLDPGPLDTGVSAAQLSAILQRFAPRLIRAVVGRMHASASRAVLHVHAPLGWWRDDPQPLQPYELVELARHDPPAAERELRRGIGPHESGPRAAIRKAWSPVHDTRMWVWPFDHDATYVVCATLSQQSLAGRSGSSGSCRRGYVQ